MCATVTFLLSNNTNECTRTTLSVPHVAKRLIGPQLHCRSTLYSGSRPCHEISGMTYFIMSLLRLTKSAEQIEITLDISMLRQSNKTISIVMGHTSSFVCCVSRFRNLHSTRAKYDSSWLLQFTDTQTSVGFSPVLWSREQGLVTRVHFSRVSVLVSRPKRQGLLPGTVFHTIFIKSVTLVFSSAASKLNY